MAWPWLEQAHRGGLRLIAVERRCTVGGELVQNLPELLESGAPLGGKAVDEPGEHAVHVVSLRRVDADEPQRALQDQLDDILASSHDIRVKLRREKRIKPPSAPLCAPQIVPGNPIRGHSDTTSLQVPVFVPVLVDVPARAQLREPLAEAVEDRSEEASRVMQDDAARPRPRSSSLTLRSSVLVRWFKTRDEDLLREARALLGEVGARPLEVHVPALLLYEVGNILLLETRLGPAGLDDAIDQLETLPFAVAPPATHS